MKKVIIFILFLLNISLFAQQKKFITYQVKSGETLQNISNKLSLSTEEILKLNPDVKGGNLSQVKVLVIPNRDYSKQGDLTNYETKMVEGKDIIVDGYVYHEVLPKENLFRISQKYRVESGVLKHYNSFLMFKGLEPGQILKIPLNESKIKVDETTMLPYVVKPKETKYSIANRYGITIDSLEILNPEIKNGLKIDQVIFVPKEIGVSSQFEVHTVQKGETLYSLSKLFDISQEELILLNPELEKEVKEGVLIKIPRNEELVFNEEIGEKRSLKMAMMLPFLTEKDSLSAREGRIQNIATDFYFGALIALDSIKKQGISVDVQVLDTKKSEFVSKKISSGSSLLGTDLIIGPLFLNNLKAVANNIKGKDIMIVSPISGQDHSFINNMNLIQDTPTDEHLSFEMLQFVKENYSGQNLLLVANDKQETQLNSILKDLNSVGASQKISIIKPKKGYIKPEVFKTKLDSISENWVLLFGKDDVLAADVVYNLGVLPEKYDLTLFTLNKPKSFEKIDNNFLSRVKLHYPSSSFLDYDSLSIQRFINKYSRRFGGFPSQYAFKGFDVTYDILLRLSQDNSLTSQGFSRRLEAKYNFIENTSGNLVNNSVYIIEYDGLDLKVVE